MKMKMEIKTFLKEKFMKVKQLFKKPKQRVNMEWLIESFQRLKEENERVNSELLIDAFQVLYEENQRVDGQLLRDAYNRFNEERQRVNGVNGQLLFDAFQHLNEEHQRVNRQLLADAYHRLNEEHRRLYGGNGRLLFDAFQHLNEEHQRKHVSRLNEAFQRPLTESRWTPLPNMINSTYRAAAVVVNGHQFLVTGGFCDGSREDPLRPPPYALRSCEYYDVNTTTWNLLPVPLPRGMCCHGIAFVGNQVLVMGGTTDSRFDEDDENNSSHYRDLFALRIPDGGLSAITTEQWEPLAPMRQRRSKFAYASDDRFVYVFGGFGGDGRNAHAKLATAERYDTETNVWTQLPDMIQWRGNIERADFAAGMIGSKIFVVGGDWHAPSSIIAFDVITEQWEMITELDKNYIVHDHLVVTVDRFLVIININKNTWPDDTPLKIAVFDTKQNVWSYGRVRSPARVGAVAGVLKAATGTQATTIIVAGGEDEHEEDNLEDIIQSITTADTISFATGILPSNFRANMMYELVRFMAERGYFNAPHLVGDIVAAEIARRRDYDMNLAS